VLGWQRNGAQPRKTPEAAKRTERTIDWHIRVDHSEFYQFCEFGGQV
jgi:hypothetical protein